MPSYKQKHYRMTAAMYAEHLGRWDKERETTIHNAYTHIIEAETKAATALKAVLIGEKLTQDVYKSGTYTVIARGGSLITSELLDTFHYREWELMPIEAQVEEKVKVIMIELLKIIYEKRKEILLMERDYIMRALAEKPARHQYRPRKNKGDGSGD